MKNEKDKFSVGRPKLADEKTKNKSYLMITISIMLVISLCITGFLSLTRFNSNNLQGKISIIDWPFKRSDSNNTELSKKVFVSSKKEDTVSTYKNYITNFTLYNLALKKYYYRWFTYPNYNFTGTPSYKSDCYAFSKTKKVKPSLNVTANYPNRSGKYKIYMDLSSCQSDNSSTSTNKVINEGGIKVKYVKTNYTTISKNANKTTSASTLSSFALKDDIEVTRFLKGTVPNNTIRVTQGFAADDNYFYIAFVSNDDIYTQKTIVQKYDIVTKKLIKQVELGKIGHSNSLTYNSKTNRIIISSGSDRAPFFIQLTTDLKFEKNLYIKDWRGVNKQSSVGSLVYDKLRNRYITTNQGNFGVLDGNMKWLSTINVNINNKGSVDKSYIPQAIYTDSSYIYDLHTNMTSVPYVNYLNVFSLTGNLMKRYTIKQNKLIDKNVELEQMTQSNGTYYINANSGGISEFSIYKVNFKK